MKNRDHIPLGVGFYPDWFYNHYGISFDEKYYFDPETRVEARMEIDKRLHERFGDVGLGNPDPDPKPLITFGMVMLPAIFGCEIIYEKDALPWAMPLNLSAEAVMELEVPDIFSTYPMTAMIKQIEYLKDKYGGVVGDINPTGVQNLALKIRGEQLYIDFFENPDLCRHLLEICTECVIQLFQFSKKLTGTGAVDVTPMCDPELCVLPNCTAEQISLETYREFVLGYDNRVADACMPVGIHHCGSVDEVLEGYAEVRHLEFLEVGFGSDVRRVRDVLGPGIAVNARISPVLMKNGTTEEVEEEVRRLIGLGEPLDNFSIDTVGLTFGTPDDNVKTALRSAAACGKIGKEGASVSVRKPSRHRAARAERVETVVSGPAKEVVIGPERPVVLIGERINPTGRKDLSQALLDNNFEMIKSEALAQVDAGADLIDVNVGVSGIDEAGALRSAVLAVREVTGVPLCIDSALPEALEAALEVCEGKALVNSVNGEERKLARILPIVKAHGAAVIGLTMDDKGIPARAEDRLEIAGRILEKAEKAGIPRQDVIIDPLAMAVSADHTAGLETLKALRLIRDRLGLNQTLGLSNISFGLPGRNAMNAVFLAMAVENGLTCPITDPTVWDMKQARLLVELILGRDPFCAAYISGLAKATGRDTLEESGGTVDLESLKYSVIHGKRETAREITQRALDAGTDPGELIDDYLIPALNTVGERFEAKKIFVPEMMIAAKSMQACIDLVKPHISGERGVSLGTVVLGTVFGDLHDIGKNLAALLLESSGFRVVNIGENVPAATFLEKAREEEADIVGISSLLTTGDPYVEETVRSIKESDIAGKVKVICGGAALMADFVEEVCGADAYAKDAADGVKKAKSLLGMDV